MEKLGFTCAKFLSEKAAKNSHIWVLDGDLADSNGAEIFAHSVPDKFIAAGIAEQNMVSMAAGLAREGELPWVFSFAAFLCYRAYDQIRVGVSQTNLPVTLVGSHAGGCSGRNGKSHTALNDIAVMSTLPSLEIWAPADEMDTKAAVEAIIYAQKPAYIRLPRDPLGSLGLNNKTNVQWIGKPTRNAIISYGLSTQWAIKVKEILESWDIDISILHFRKVWPIETYVIKTLLEKVQRAFVIEDHYPLGGLASLLSYSGYRGDITPFGWPLHWSGQSGDAKDLLENYQLSPNAIARKIKEQMKPTKSLYIFKNKSPSTSDVTQMQGGIV